MKIYLRRQNKRKLLLFFVAVITVIILDRLSKHLVLVSENYELNAGIALSFFSGSALLSGLLSFTGLIVICYFLVKAVNDNINSTVYYLLLGVVWGGGVSNMGDRLIYGGVIDFIRIASLPVFNLADAAISLGIIGIVGYYFLNENHKHSIKQN